MAKRFSPEFLLTRFRSSKESPGLLPEEPEKLLENTGPTEVRIVKRQNSLSYASWALVVVFAAAAVFSFSKTADLSSKNQSLSEEVRKFKATIEAMEKEKKGLTEQIGAIENEKKSLKDALEAVKKEIEFIRFEFKKSESTLDAAKEEKTYLEDILIHKTKEIEQLKNSSTVNLGTVTVDSMHTGRPAVSTGARKEARTLPKKSGKVLAYNEDHNFVIIDLGQSDGITNDSQISLKQNGEVAATLSLIEVRDTMSACNVKDLRPGKKVAVNDLVVLK